VGRDAVLIVTRGGWLSVYNLAGEKVDDGANPHYGDTSADGTFVTESARYEGEWTFHSFCSAHLEEKLQWGANLGLEDSIFLTVEEWTSLDAVSAFPHTKWEVGEGTVWLPSNSLLL
jgi:hypothetical protein